MIEQKSRFKDQIKKMHGIEQKKKDPKVKFQSISTAWQKINILNEETEIIKEEIVNAN